MIQRVLRPWDRSLAPPPPACRRTGFAPSGGRTAEAPRVVILGWRFFQSPDLYPARPLPPGPLEGAASSPRGAFSTLAFCEAQNELPAVQPPRRCASAASKHLKLRLGIGTQALTADAVTRKAVPF